jgi:hypothetical protein
MRVLKDNVACLNNIKIAWRVLDCNLLGLIGLKDWLIRDDLEISGVRVLNINSHLLP